MVMHTHAALSPQPGTRKWRRRRAWRRSLIGQPSEPPVAAVGCPVRLAGIHGSLAFNNPPDGNSVDNHSDNFIIYLSSGRDDGQIGMIDDPAATGTARKCYYQLQRQTKNKEPGGTACTVSACTVPVLCAWWLLLENLRSQRNKGLRLSRLVRLFLLQILHAWCILPVLVACTV